MQEGKKEGDKIMAAKSYKMNSACFVKLNVYGEAEPCNGEQRLVSNSNGTEERAAASTTSVPSPNLKLVPEPDWMGAQGEAEGGRLVNAKIEILGSTDLYSGVGLARFSSPLRGGPDWNAKNQLVFFTCSTLRLRGEQERANAVRERGQRAR